MTQLVRTVPIPQLDYANALHVELPGTLFDRLQRIQNAALRLIFQKKRPRHPLYEETSLTACSTTHRLQGFGTHLQLH